MTAGGQQEGFPLRYRNYRLICI